MLVYVYVIWLVCCWFIIKLFSYLWFVYLIVLFARSWCFVCLVFVVITCDLLVSFNCCVFVGVVDLVFEFSGYCGDWLGWLFV